MLKLMRIASIALFIFICTFVLGIPSASSATTTAQVISQYIGASEPYDEIYGSNTDLNSQRYFVATGTLSSFVASMASPGGFTGTERISVKLFNNYFSQWIDCQTPTKTVDEWGITRIARDPHAPLVSFGPFSGSKCLIDGDTSGYRTTSLFFRLGESAEHASIGVMGSKTVQRSNFTAYGPDIFIPPPSITLLGSATTTVEFGSVFTDPGATAADETDGDLTSSIRITGSVDTSTTGTTTLAYSVTNSHGLSATTTRQVVVACTHDCVSNVLFLPGIEGSRLYEGVGCGKAAEEKLWEPVADSISGILRGAGDEKVRDLALDATGASACSDIYAKEGDVIDSVRGSNIYASLMNEMNVFKTDGTIRDWKPVAYDWRLSLDDLLTKGTQHGDKIYYEEATSTPYIEQTLRALAARSKTGKATIIAHSNGGLVTKALLNRLGNEAASLVDRVILVGVPQSGAPQDVGSMLVGHGAGLYAGVGPFREAVTIVSNRVARAFSQNSPMAYHLLPSQGYFDSVMYDPAHPVASFAGDAYAKEETAYGNVIGTATELTDFLLAKEGGRMKPEEGDLRSVEILSSPLIDYAKSTHATLDSWTPPSGIEVSQIAGWGVDTVSGIDFYTLPAVSALSALEPVRTYRPIFVEDGDGTVPVPSALMMASSTGVKRFWVDLHSHNKDLHQDRKHSDLFEVSSLRDFIKNLLQNSTSTLPAYISSTQPASQNAIKKLTFFLHSPLTLQITDTASGSVTGLATDGSVTEDIAGSIYGEFGEVKYITVPAGSGYKLSLQGQASGTFSLDMQESSGGVVTASSTIANVPVATSTLASLTISSGLDTASALTVDENGDGKAEISIKPMVGETLNYQPPAPEPEPEPQPQVRSSGGGGSHTAPVAVPQAVVATTSPLQASQEQPAATTTAIELSVATVPPAPTSSPAMSPRAWKQVSPIAALGNARTEKTEKTNRAVPQTASALDAASQQPFLRNVGSAVYNGLHGFWSALKKFF